MGAFDELKTTAEGLLHGHGDDVDKAVDKATDMIDDKTGHKYDSVLQQVDDAVDKETDKLDS